MIAPIQRNRLALYIAQVPATALVLAFLPSNLGKLMVLLIVWALTFRRVRRKEFAFLLVICGFFTGMNAISLDQGIFSFARPDVLGMPYYELAMWGFYVLHTMRVVNGPPAPWPTGTVWILALSYSVTFATIHDPILLLLASGALLCIALVRFHERHDFYYTGYMIALGAVIEYTGVLSGEWYYPGSPLGGVPWWFITLWGGVGLLLRRLALPVLARFDDTGGQAPGRANAHVERP